MSRETVPHTSCSLARTHGVVLPYQIAWQLNQPPDLGTLQSPRGVPPASEHRDYSWISRAGNTALLGGWPPHVPKMNKQKAVGVPVSVTANVLLFPHSCIALVITDRPERANQAQQGQRRTSRFRKQGTNLLSGLQGSERPLLREDSNSQEWNEHQVKNPSLVPLDKATRHNRQRVVIFYYRHVTALFASDQPKLEN